MQLDRSLFRGNPVARVIVSVDKVENGEPCGDYLSIYMPEPEAYVGIVPMINGMDSYFDRMDYPQAYNAYRSFEVAEQAKEEKPRFREAASEELFEVKRGKLATFLVQVLFRQNTEWQGMITWMEGKKTQRFRSTLEMMGLMERAMSGVTEENFGEW